MIRIIIAILRNFILRHLTLSELIECRRRRLQEWEFNCLKLCLELYYCEEKKGIQHTYTLEEVSQVFKRKIEEVRLLYDIIDYKRSSLAQGIWQDVLI